MEDFKGLLTKLESVTKGISDTVIAIADLMEFASGQVKQIKSNMGVITNDSQPEFTGIDLPSTTTQSDPFPIPGTGGDASGNKTPETAGASNTTSQPAKKPPIKTPPAKKPPVTAQPATTTPAETQPATPKVTVDDIREQLKGIIISAPDPQTGQDAALDILKPYGASKISDLKPDQYEAVWNDCTNFVHQETGAGALG